MATDAQLLEDAKAALHDLLIGVAAVQVHQGNGESVRYTPADESKLRVYIAQLEAKIAGSTAKPKYRPLYPVF